MWHNNANFTPTDKEPLCKDIGGEPYSEEWNYGSILGIIL